MAAEFKAVHLNISTVSDQVACLTQPTQDCKDMQGIVNVTSSMKNMFICSLCNSG